MSQRRFSKRSLWLGLALFLLGGLIVAAIHFLTFNNPNVHYHANFALYVNGQRDEFKSFTFYEEVQSCSSDNKDNPKTRAHLHDQNPGLVHVHANGVTWGHFFANLGYALGDRVLQTDKGVFVDGQDGNKLSFILNGQPTDTIANQVIKSEDKLLINYGNDTETILAERYQTVPTDARKANTEHDPASCSGGAPVNGWQRIKDAFIN